MRMKKPGFDRKLKLHCRIYEGHSLSTANANFLFVSPPRPRHSIVSHYSTPFSQQHFIDKYDHYVLAPRGELLILMYSTCRLSSLSEL